MDLRDASASKDSMSTCLRKDVGTQIAVKPIGFWKEMAAIAIERQIRKALGKAMQLTRGMKKSVGGQF